MNTFLRSCIKNEIPLQTISLRCVNDKNMIDHLLDNFHCHKSKQILDFLLLNYTFKKTTADVPTRQNIT